MTDSRSLFITGFMGSGKTTIARHLSALTGIAWFDLDDVIQKNEQMSIKDIFRIKGERHFRQLEAGVIEELAAPRIVSLGGGAFIEPGVRTQVSSNGLSIFLDVPFGTLWERVRGKKKRPLVKSYGELLLLMEKRKFLYNLADIVYPATVLDQPRNTAIEIYHELSEWKKQSRISMQ